MKRETIFIDTIDIYCAEQNINRIDFLKIDVEGHEFEVLRGASKMLRANKIKIIQFEYGGSYLDAHVFLKDIFRYFENFNNYKFFKILPNSLEYIANYNQQLDNFQYSNFAVIFN